MTPSKKDDNAEKEIKYQNVENLLFDENNPRFGGIGSESEQQEILDHIVKHFGVDDILSSLAVNGYFESEPLICQKSDEDGKFIVKEGNRRLAACLIISNDSRASNQGKRGDAYRKIWEQNKKPTITPVPTIIFPSNDRKILSYLGVRHIASTQPWDSYAKAAWVAQVVEKDGLAVSEISQMIGDQHKTIARLLEGYYFVQQLKIRNFNPEDSVRKGRGSVSEYPFSWVYTILGYTNVRDFLGISNESTKKPLPEENLQKGELVLKSMFGDKSQGQSSAISDSRQLGALSKVFADEEKITLLKQGKGVDEIEELTQPIEQQLADGLGRTRDILRNLIARLSEHSISQGAAESLTESSSGNRNLATNIDKEIQKIASGSDDE